MCVSLTSVERTSADGVENFLRRMEGGELVGSVEKVGEDERNGIELYVTRGRAVR